MSFPEAVISYFTKWLNFKTRSSRSEYWWAVLFLNIAFFVLSIIIAWCLPAILSIPGCPIGIVIAVVGIAQFIVQIFCTIAGIALMTRRLHDVDKSGWWQLLSFTGFGIIPLLIWACRKGTEGENRFGKDPLGN